MVPTTRFEGTPKVSPGVHKTILSIKEIVGNHSEAEIYTMLKENNMDPNETAQKLLNQDPFREVKRKRDKKKENTGFSGSAEPRKQAENTVKGHAASTSVISRRGGPTRNSLPDTGASREFRVVRDNRVNQNAVREIKAVHILPTQRPRSGNVQETQNISDKRSIHVDRRDTHIRNSDTFKSSPASNRPISASGKNQVPKLNETQGKESSAEIRATSIDSRVEREKPSVSQSHSATTNSVLGVYSSSLDPVHVPSPDSRSSGNVGAIRREVGVVGVRKQTSANLPKNSSAPISSSITPVSAKDASAISGTVESSNAPNKSDPSGQKPVPESTVPAAKSFLSNHHSGRQYQQVVGHQKAPQYNKAWKPKSNQKSTLTSAGVTGTSSTPVSPPVTNSPELTKEVDHLNDKLSQVNIFENQHVIIPQHLRVREADKTHLTFGSFGAVSDSNSTAASGFQPLEEADQPNLEPSMSVSAPPYSTEENAKKELSPLDPVGNSGSDSLESVEASQHIPENNESTSPGNLDNYVDISKSHALPEIQQQQNAPEVSSFSVYDQQTGYDMRFFRPSVDESVRDQGQQQEALGSHVITTIPASTMAMMRQQSVGQLYPQVHVPHYPNFVPYRHVYSPFYFQSPGYAGNPSGFGGFANPGGYLIGAQGGLGGASGLEESTRMEYKDDRNLYVPSHQVDTSEFWTQTPRELPGVQATPFFNVQGQAPHGQYLQSQSGHASFSGPPSQSAAHMQFPGMYHSTAQPPIGNTHHMVQGMGGNVGVGMGSAAPGAQISYQQHQIGHLSWPQTFENVYSIPHQ